jgi:hypothetical protein
VGYLLALGILVAPYIFGWFVLRAGYSTLARAVALGWSLVVLTGAFTMHSNDQDPPLLSGAQKVAAERSISEMESAWNAREGLVSTAESARLCEIRANSMVEAAENQIKEEVRAYGMNASKKGTAGGYFFQIKRGWFKLAQYCHEARWYRASVDKWPGINQRTIVAMGWRSGHCHPAYPARQATQNACQAIILNTMILCSGFHPRAGCANFPWCKGNRGFCDWVLTPMSFRAQIGAVRDGKILMRFVFGEELSLRREFKFGAMAKEIAAIVTGRSNGAWVAVVGECLMSVQGMPVENRPDAALERVISRSAADDATLLATLQW